jgi:AraC-like DNA-binding protein
MPLRLLPFGPGSGHLTDGRDWWTDGRFSSVPVYQSAFGPGRRSMHTVLQYCRSSPSPTLFAEPELRILSISYDTGLHASSSFPISTHFHLAFYFTRHHQGRSPSTLLVLHLVRSLFPLAFGSTLHTHEPPALFHHFRA